MVQVRAQYEIRGTSEEIISGIEKLTMDKYQKKPIISTTITEKTNRKEFMQKLKDYESLFIFRQPLMDINAEGKSPDVSFDDTMPEVFAKYFDSKKKSELALEIYKSVRDRDARREEILEICREILNDN